MNKLFKILCVIFILSIPSSLFGLTANYQDEDVRIDLIYTDTLFPGDAIFVRMTIQTPKSNKRSKDTTEKSAVLKLFQGKKLIETSNFYSTNKNKKAGCTELMAAVPLSSWLTDKEYSLKVILNLAEEDAREFNLPLTFKSRVFDEETIYLNPTNTAIKTDNSPQRAAQIEKLNEILFSVNSDAVYNLKAFKSPTTSTRYTSHFADRRIYAYSNGKSSTSLHYGNDYGIPTGSPVESCGDGKVVLAEMRNSTGWSIVIEHLPGLYSLYYHLDEMLVKEGDMVKAGELIGKSGCTGLATGPHLHWEIRLNGSAVHPEFFLNDFAFETVEY